MIPAQVSYITFIDVNHAKSVLFHTKNEVTLHSLDIVGTVYHFVIYMQSNKIYKVIFNE